MIQHFIIHEIEKNKGDTEASFKASTEELDIDTEARSFVRDLHESISDSTKKVYGRFYQQGESYFERKMREYLVDGSTDGFFVAISDLFGLKSDDQSLISYIQHAPLATGGHILFVEYEMNGNSFVVVAMLNNRQGKAIVTEGGKPKIVATEQIDFNLMDVACRINMTAYSRSKSEQNYLCFFTSRDTISQYFINFIGCEHFNQPKDNTRKLIDLIDRSIRPEEDRGEVRTSAYNYCSQRQTSNIVLDDLSEHIFGSEHRRRLNEMATTEDIRIDSSFVVMQRELSRLLNFRFKGDWIDLIRFDKKNIAENIVTDGDDVTLKNVPQLVRRVQDERR